MLLVEGTGEAESEGSRQMSEHPFMVTLRERFGGVISSGKNEANGKACGLECAHAAALDEWSDDPDKWPDTLDLACRIWIEAAKP